MRFVDELMHRVLKPQGSNPVIVKIDNVAKYYYEGTNQELFDWNKDFPNLAPPWPSALYAYKQPPQVNCENGVMRVTNPSEYAVLAGSADLYEDAQRLAALRMFERQGLQPAKSAMEQARWLSVFTLYERHRFPMPILSLIAYIDNHGQYVLPSDNGRVYLYMLNEEAFSDTYEQESVGRTAQVVFEPVMLAISFLHCRNVTMQSVTPPPKLFKRAIERSGVPMNVYKVLEICQVAKVLEASADRGTSLVKRLHICRGHFKDYTEHGLFGRERGLFWWGQHVRGSEKVGTVTKDYEVTEPPR